MKTFFCLLLAFWVFCPVIMGQNQTRETVQREQLKKLMSKVAVDVVDTGARTAQRPTYRELKIRWTDSSKTNALSPEAQTKAPSASIVEDNKRSGTLPRQRSLELSSTQIFIAAVDASNKLRWWSTMPDPRVVRYEAPTATGEIHRQDFYASNVTLLVAFPDDPEIATLRIYHPVWNGTEFNLQPLSILPTR
jgi:hypothetical protein